MGFLSYNLQYFTNEIARTETFAGDGQMIYHAKQLLKMLDDLSDEGYTELSDLLEVSCQGVSRLKKYLSDNHAAAFLAFPDTPARKDMKYSVEETELTNAIGELVAMAKESPTTRHDAFLSELVWSCEWVGYKENTAYIFLLRDTLLPYIYYRSKSRGNIHPWLLGRKTLSWMTGIPNVDDEFRAPIYKALELGKVVGFDDFCGIVLPRMRTAVGQYPQLEKSLTKLLRTITAEQIIVIESGCSGTFPMLLKSLDERVDIRMYTTYPYLLEAYGARIYSAKYEENRLFETLFSQDMYLQFSAWRENRFYVRICDNEEIRSRSCEETKTILTLSV